MTVQATEIAHVSPFFVLKISVIASQITSLTIVYSTIYSCADQRKHQRSASLAFVRGISRWPANSTHKGPITQKMFPFDDVIMCYIEITYGSNLPLSFKIISLSPGNMKKKTGAGDAALTDIGKQFK